MKTAIAKNEQTILAFAQWSVFSQDDSQLKQEFFVPLLLRYVNKKIQFPYLYEKSDEFPIFNQCCTRGDKIDYKIKWPTFTLLRHCGGGSHTIKVKI